MKRLGTLRRVSADQLHNAWRTLGRSRRVQRQLRRVFATAAITESLLRETLTRFPRKAPEYGRYFEVPLFAGLPIIEDPAVPPDEVHIKSMRYTYRITGLRP